LRQNDVMATSVISLSEAARRLGCSESWLRQRVSRKLIPSTRLAGKIGFTEDHLAAIVAMHEVDVEAGPHPLIQQMRDHR
jgi:hypothetical protein